MEDDYQFLAPLRHNGGHLWSITTIYYGFSTSPTGHCTPCAEYRSSHSTQLSTCQSQKPPDLRMFQKDARCYDTELVVQIIGGIFKQDQDLLPHPRCYDGVMRSQMMTSQRSHNSVQFFKDALEDADEGSLDEAHSIDIQIAQCY